MSTGIQWTDDVWNPVVGCTRVSAGCDHCYAFELHDKRFAANQLRAKQFSGLHEPGERHIRGDESWMQWAERVGKPAEGWAARARSLGMALPLPSQYDLPFSQVQLMPERLEKPLHWRKPRRVFVNSMSDLFHEDVPDEFIDRVVAVMALTPQHTYQVLTKRPERMRAYMSGFDAPVRLEAAANLRGSTFVYRGMGAPDGSGWCGPGWPLPNVWLGTSVEDGSQWHRVEELLATPAAVHFLSLEPLLGPVDLSRIVRIPDSAGQNTYGDYRIIEHIDWVIIGGESGPHARPCNIEWIRDGVRQCQAADVPAFVKQLGSWPCDGSDPYNPAVPIKLRSRHGSDPDEWPSDLRVREFPEVAE